MTAGKRVATVLAVLALAFLAFLALAPRSYAPDASDLANEIAERAGYRWQSGTFDGVVVSDSAIRTVMIDGQSLAVEPAFVIQRALMRRPLPVGQGELALLELPDSEGWNDYRGSTAWFEVSDTTGDVSRLIVAEKPR